MSVSIGGLAPRSARLVPSPGGQRHGGWPEFLRSLTCHPEFGTAPTPGDSAVGGWRARQDYAGEVVWMHPSDGTHVAYRDRVKRTDNTPAVDAEVFDPRPIQSDMYKGVTYKTNGVPLGRGAYGVVYAYTASDPSVEYSSFVVKFVMDSAGDKEAGSVEQLMRAEAFGEIMAASVLVNGRPFEWEGRTRRVTVIALEPGEPLEVMGAQMEWLGATRVAYAVFQVSARPLSVEQAVAEFLSPCFVGRSVVTFGRFPGCYTPTSRWETCCTRQRHPAGIEST